MNFVEPLASYKSDVDPYQQARTQLLTYIEKTYRVDNTEANIIYKAMIKERDVKDPILTFLRRENGLDQIESSSTLLEYIEEHKIKNESMTPSFTCYSREEKSYQGMFIEDGLSNRSAKKKLARVCEAKGDDIGFIINNLLQKAFKLRNNSLSGAYLSMSTLFYNPSSHTALTSGTRIAASLANMVTESMVAGKRFYRDPESVINHFLSILSTIDKDKIKTTNDKYSIIGATPNDVMSMVIHSIRDYWSNTKYLNNIRTFVNTLDEYELSAILYTYDIYHLENTNLKFTRTMLDTLSKKYTGEPQTIEVLKDYPEPLINIVHHICFDYIRGKGTDYREFSSKLQDLIVSTTINLSKNLSYYQDFIDTYLKSEVMPINVAFIKDMIMEAVSHSDTDSTCGWFGHRVEERFGHTDMTERGIAYFSVYMMFNEGVVANLLRQLTANYNVSIDKRDKLGMKNEYYFPVFASGNVTKHYISNIAIKEGLVYEEPKLEIKGNSLISSNNASFIRDHFKDMIKDITNTLTNGKRLDSKKILSNVANLERDIRDRLVKGDASIFKLDKINNTYKAVKDDSSKWPSTNIYHHVLYEKVFKDKYGSPGELPYLGVSIPIYEDKLVNLVDTIEDVVIREKFLNFIHEHPKNSMSRIIYPFSIISTTGFPKELMPMIDDHKLISLLLNGHYVVLEKLGLYIKEGYLLTDQGY